MTKRDDDPRTTNAGAWAEWIETVPQEQREKVFALAERILPFMCSQDHTRYHHLDDAAISSALRCAQRFYARIGMWGSEPVRPTGRCAHECEPGFCRVVGCRNEGTRG